MIAHHVPQVGPVEDAADVDDPSEGAIEEVEQVRTDVEDSPFSWRHGDPAYSPPSKPPDSQRALPPLHGPSAAASASHATGLVAKRKVTTMLATPAAETASASRRGTIEGFSDRLLEDEVASSSGRIDGDLRLDGGWHGEGDDVDAVDQRPDVVEGAGPVRRGEGTGCLRPSGPHADEVEVGVGGDARGVDVLRPRSAADESCA